MSSQPIDIVELAKQRPWRRGPSIHGSEAVAKSCAFGFVEDYRCRVGLYARISKASNGVYAADAPVFTFAPSDEQEVRPMTEVGEHWTCVGMVYPL